jgi:phenylalanyl-tRNA synthetase beta chain
VARVYGYNKIEKRIPLCSTSQIPHDPAFLFERELRDRLLRLGLQEFLNCDLISPQMSEIFKEIASPSLSNLQTIYSKSEEYSILRTSLLPGLLQTTKRNLDQKNYTLSAFEIGRIHFLQQGKLVEVPMGALLLTGKVQPRHWSRKPSDADFFDLKGLIETLFDSIRLSGCSFSPSQHLSLHSGRQADIHKNGLILGSFGEVHPMLLEKFDIKQRVLFAEINLNLLREERTSHRQMEQLPQFPSSERDWTVPLDKNAQIDFLFKSVQSIQSPLLQHVELIDLYSPEGAKKNATFRFVYRDPLKTISFDEVEAEHAKILKTLESAVLTQTPS